MPLTYAITGTSSGIGLELCKRLTARGDKVFALCRSAASSASGEDNLSGVGGDLTIVPGIDVTDDNVSAKLAASALNGVAIDVLIHNAGGINANYVAQGMAAVQEQKLEAVTPQRMLDTFNLNCVGVLRIQQALQSQLKSPGGKVCVISTGMGSINDNGSGGEQLRSAHL